jgi:PAS domain S-box-containing protein
LTTEGDRQEAARRRALDGVGLRALFDATSLPMVVADDDRHWIDANAAACRMLGMSRADLLERTIDDLTPAELHAELERLWERLLRTGSLSGAFRFTLPDGRGMPFDYSAVANVADGYHVGFVLPTRRSERVKTNAGPRKTASLSAREREIMQRVALGQDGPEIAADLVVSPATVRTHIGNAIKKLGARSRAHAIALALQSGALDD